MLHRISEFCQKIDSIQAQSNRLYYLKYKQPKTTERDAEINHLIEDIQSQCKLMGNDKNPYKTQVFRGLTNRHLYDRIN